jgi:histidinol-phosphate aminotransferase
MDTEIAEILNRIRQPFNVNSLAQVAAEAALDDVVFFNKSIQAAHEGLDFLFSALETMGIRCLPTQSNFLMADLETDATQVFEELLKQGVIVRSMHSYGYDTFIRVNAGTKQENSVFVQALKRVLKR